MEIIEHILAGFLCIWKQFLLSIVMFALMILLFYQQGVFACFNETNKRSVPQYIFKEQKHYFTMSMEFAEKELKKNYLYMVKTNTLRNK